MAKAVPQCREDIVAKIEAEWSVYWAQYSACMEEVDSEDYADERQAFFCEKLNEYK